MIESRRHEALTILEERQKVKVGYWVGKAKHASDGLELIQMKSFFSGNAGPLQRFFERRRLEGRLRIYAQNADNEATKLELLSASEELSVVSSRKRPLFGRPQNVNELVGRIGKTHISLVVGENGRVIEGYVNGLDIRDCKNKDSAQNIFDTYYPVVLERDTLAASLQRNSML